MTVPEAPGIPARQRRYSIRVVSIARRMYGDGDTWTPTQIRDYLIRSEGLDETLALSTVRRWVIPAESESQRENNRLSYQRRKGLVKPKRRQATVLERMLELRRIGLSYNSIARVVSHDFGVNMNAEQARYYVQNRREPRRLK